MKKILMIALCLGIVPMLFAAQEDAIQKTGFFFESGARIRIISETEFEAMVDLQTEDSLYYYTSDPTANAIGFGSATTWEGAIRFTPTELAPYVGDDITAVWWYHYDGSSPNGRVIIYDNGTPVLPGPVLQQDPYTGAATGWVRCDLSSNVTITGAGDLWASIEVQDPGSGFFPIGVDAGPAIDGKGDWVYEASLGWTELQSHGLDFNWSLIAIVVSGGVTSHDVGTMAILAPDATELPNTTLNPQATYRNYGDFTETFDVYFEIDSLGVPIYSQTANITRDPGTDTTITWPSWTTSPIDGFTYDITAYTVLAGDENPANDTLTQTCTIQSVYWEILTDIPSATSGHSESTVHDGTYLVTGFHPSSGYPSTVYEYDIAGDSWATVTSNPYGCGAYGMAYGVLGKHYRIGGTDGWPTSVNRVDIYDPGSDTWSAGATAPMANMDQTGGVYNDSLIFMFGGGNWGSGNTPHTNVYFYDIYTDAWSTCTSLPSPGRGCLASGVIGDYAIVACGYDGTGTYRSDYIVGNIDPLDPTSITWGSSTTIPGGFEGRYRTSSGVDAPATQAQEFWVTCGQGNSNPQCADIWSYEPVADVWTDWNMPKNRAIGNVNTLAITSSALDDIGVYVVGGYTGSYITDHECFHTGKVAVEERPGQHDPSAVFGFAANMKNPSDGYSGITYTTTKSGKIMVKVYDATGRLVKTLVNRTHEPAGTKTVYWNAKDDERCTVANGVYFIRLEAKNQIDTHKMILVK